MYGRNDGKEGKIGKGTYEGEKERQGEKGEIRRSTLIKIKQNFPHM